MVLKIFYIKVLARLKSQCVKEMFHSKPVKQLIIKITISSIVIGLKKTPIFH